MRLRSFAGEFWLLQAAALVLWSGTAKGAEDQFADGKTCFCLRHEPTKQIMRNCTGERPPNDFYITATCHSLQPGDKQTTTIIQSPWIAVPAGSEGCEICSIRRPSVTRPRGEDK